MKNLSNIIIFTFLFYFANCQSPKEFKPTFKTSKNTTHKISAEQDYTFGYLEVLENRNNPNSKTIKIPVYIFKSRSANPKPDPIIYTVGGPGSTTMPSAQYMNYYKYLDDRDFILVEQRGNYYAQPHLDCPEWAKANSISNLPNFNKNQSDNLFTNAAINCRKRLKNKGIDLNGYNTNEIAADIEDLRKVIGIEKYNLLTISYSTKIAQVLIRDYPKAIRSVVMDSPLPLEANYDEESVSNLLEVVNKLLSDCESNTDCNKAFPGLKNRFFNYLKERTLDPLAVSIKNPNSSTIETFYLKGSDLITIFTSTSTNNFPFEINKLLNDNLSTIKKRLSNLFKAPSEGQGIGMRLSVWCAEEYPFSSKKIIENETNQYPEIVGLSPAVFDSSICNIWNIKKVSDIENKAVKSNIPVLLINGEYDNETPSKWAKRMQKNLVNSYHLIFKGWKHTLTTNWNNQCAMEAANDFFNSPHETPNSECLKAIKSLKFKTRKE